MKTNIVIPVLLSIFLGLAVACNPASPISPAEQTEIGEGDGGEGDGGQGEEGQGSGEGQDEGGPGEEGQGGGEGQDEGGEDEGGQGGGEGQDEGGQDEGGQGGGEGQGEGGETGGDDSGEGGEAGGEGEGEGDEGGQGDEQYPVQPAQNYSPFGFKVLSEKTIRLEAGAETMVRYTLEGEDSGTSVSIQAAAGGYSATINQNERTVSISAPAVPKDGYILLKAIRKADGYLVLQRINLAALEYITVSKTEFWTSGFEYADSLGNTNTVCYTGDGSAAPAVTEDGHIVLYQNKSGNAKNGGNYMDVRANADAGVKIAAVGVRSATPTKFCYTLNGAMSGKSAITEIPAGGTYSVTGLENCSSVRIFCMGTSKSERAEIDSLAITYTGGYSEADYIEDELESGRIANIVYPFREDFDSGKFPCSSTPSYLKFGYPEPVGPDGLFWSTWYGCFSTQNPIGGDQSAQLRAYQEDPDYYGNQWGWVKTEFFCPALTRVTFDSWASVYWLQFTVSYFDYDNLEWCNPQTFKPTVAEKETVVPREYVLDGGNAHTAKIRVEINPATGYPSKGHLDLILDNFVFRND